MRNHLSQSVRRILVLFGKPGLFLIPVEAGTNPTFVSPIRDSVGHVLLLIAGRETQRLTAGARLVVDISVKHKGLARAAHTEGANPLSQSARPQAAV